MEEDHSGGNDDESASGWQRRTNSKSFRRYTLSDDHILYMSLMHIQDDCLENHSGRSGHLRR